MINKKIINNSLIVTLNDDLNNNKYVKLDVSFNYNSNNMIYKSVTCITTTKEDYYSSNEYIPFEDSYSCYITVNPDKRKNFNKIKKLLDEYTNNNILNDVDRILLTCNSDDKIEYLNNLKDLIIKEDL